MNKNQQVLLELVRAGLWNREVQLLPSDNIDFSQIYRLAQEQSLIGIVLAGLELSSVKPPQVLLLQWIGEVQVLEQQNKAKNSFIEKLIGILRNADIYALLVKGQEIAQCYEKPLWRSCGDVDLFLSEDNYRKAVQVLRPVASSIDEENEYNKHLAMTIDGWSVELHGTLRSGLWPSIDRELDNVQYDVFYSGRVRSWMNGRTQVFLPAADEDVVFVFAHILQHFYKEGIGFRQICDWCRLLWTYKDSLNHKLLESRIKSMGVMTEWKAFAALAVDYLGIPVDAMPFYSDDKKWKRKAVRVMEFVLETGNFGHNRDYSYRNKYPYIIYKAISFWKHLKDGAFFFSTFPLDSIKVTWRRMVVGVSVVLQGKKHE